MSAPITNILVAIDFSECSPTVLAQAVRLAGQTGARLHLGFIAHSSAFIVDTTYNRDIPEEFPEARKALADLQRLQSQLASDVSAEIHVRLSMSAHDGLLGLIMELKPDLVVLGSHGKGVLKRAILGSVCHQLALSSPVPVLIVPAPGREKLMSQPAPAKSL